MYLTVIHHRKPRILRIRKRHPPRLILARNLQPIRHQPTTLRTIHHELCRLHRAALQRQRAKQSLTATRCRNDVDSAGSG